MASTASSTMNVSEGMSNVENISVSRYKPSLKGGLRAVGVDMYGFLTRRLGLCHHLIDPTSHCFCFFLMMVLKYNLKLKTANMPLEKLFSHTRYNFCDRRFHFWPRNQILLDCNRVTFVSLSLLWKYTVTRMLKKLCVCKLEPSHTVPSVGFANSRGTGTGAGAGAPSLSATDSRSVCSAILTTCSLFSPSSSERVLSPVRRKRTTLEKKRKKE